MSHKKGLTNSGDNKEIAEFLPPTITALICSTGGIVWLVGGKVEDILGGLCIVTGSGYFLYKKIKNS